VNPLTAYAKSKVMAEQDLGELAGSQFKVTSLRFATACGMSERLRLDLVLNDFVASAVALGRIDILSDGTSWRPLIAVDDMAAAIEWALFYRPYRISAIPDYLVVNVGADAWNFQVKDLAEAVCRVIPGTQVNINPKAAPDKRSYRVDFGFFRSIAPLHEPKAELTEIIAAIRCGLDAMGFSDAKFRESHLMRLNVLRNLKQRGLLDEELRWNFRASVVHRAGPAWLDHPVRPIAIRQAASSLG